MPRPSDWPTMHQRIPPRIRPSRQRRWLLLLFIVLAVVIFGGRTWLSYYVDALWFGSLGYGDVFWKTLSLQGTVFVAFTAATFLILYGTFLALKRAHLADLPSGHTIWIGQQPLKLPVDNILRLLALGVSLFIAVVTGAVMMAEWPTLALYWYAPPAAARLVDPIFGRPVTFYLFTLPAWQLISGWLLLLAVITCLAAAFFLLVNSGARRFAGGGAPVSWRALSIAFAFLLLIIAIRVYLSRFGSLFEDHTIFGGVTYTDAHVMLPGLVVICAALLIGAGIAVANAISPRRGRWLLAAIVPAVACYLVV